MCPRERKTNSRRIKQNIRARSSIQINWILHTAQSCPGHCNDSCTGILGDVSLIYIYFSYEKQAVFSILH